MKPLILYHGNCVDGFMSAFIAQSARLEDCELFYCHYGMVKGIEDIGKLPEFKGREVFILDFSFPKEVMIKIMDEAAHTTWLDHHSTAFEDWIGGKFEGHERHVQKCDIWHIELDFKRSGAAIAWDHFYPGVEMPLAVRMIDDHDRWQFKDARTKPFIRAIKAEENWTLDLFNQLCHDGIAEGYVEVGEHLLKAHMENIKNAVTAAKMGCIIHGERGLMINGNRHLASDAGHELANESGTFGLVWYVASDGRVNCSIRSNPGYDCSKIAKLFGGGGHKTASGFSVALHQVRDWMVIK